MKFDADTCALVFASEGELREFHRELTELLRQSMISGTKHIEEPAQAKRVSQELMRETRVAMSALNLLRRHLPRKQF